MKLLIVLLLFSRSVIAATSCPNNQISQKDISLSKYWAQEFIGSDLSNQIIKESSLNKSVSVHIWDNGFDLEALNLGQSFDQTEFNKTRHGTLVASLLSQNSSSSGVASKIETLSDVVSFNSPFSGASKKLKTSKRIQLINLSVGWLREASSTRPSIKEATIKNGIVVKSAGNEFYGTPSDYEDQIPNSDLLFVGSISPYGLISNFSRIRHKNIIYAPSDIYLMTDLAGKSVRFTHTSAAAPLVTGSLANAIALNPQLSRDELFDLLNKSALQIGNLKIVNSYKLAYLSQTKYLRQKDQSTLLSQNKFSRAKEILGPMFPECFNNKVSETELTCGDIDNGLELLRASFLLNQNNSDSAITLSCIYKSIGLIQQGDLYKTFINNNQKSIRQIAMDLFFENKLTEKDLVRNYHILEKDDVNLITDPNLQLYTRILLGDDSYVLEKVDQLNDHDKKELLFMTTMNESLSMRLYLQEVSRDPLLALDALIMLRNTQFQEELLWKAIASNNEFVLNKARYYLEYTSPSTQKKFSQILGDDD